MSNSSSRRRAFTGPVLFSHGFRPFFLFAGIWAALALTIWITTLATGTGVPSQMLGADWHMHEMLFGYSTAVIAGFLLTAVPNWTGRMPVVGWPVAALSGLWVAGRIAVTFSDYLTTPIAALIDVSFLVALGAIIAREVFAGKNWRNLKVLGIVSVLAIANAIFHYEASIGVAYSGYGVRLGIGAVISLIMLLGGRVIPSFTRNWMVRHGVTTLPTPNNRFDSIAMLAGGLAVVFWIALPDFIGTRALMLSAGIIHTGRVARWYGWTTLKEPLVAVLHATYAFIPIGFVSLAINPVQIPHAWMVGAIGGMTMAMMTRVSLGHSGRALKSNGKVVAIYLLLLIAVTFRMASEYFPTQDTLLYISATGWILGFFLFVVAYLPILAKPKV